MNFLSRIETVILLAGIIAVGVVSYSLFLMAHTVQELQPLIEISNDLKLKVGFAHLWFEEALESDESIDLNLQVFGNIEGAINLVKTLRSRIENLDPDPYAKRTNQLDRIQENLVAWRAQTKARWNDRVNSKAGTTSDQGYDSQFEDILVLCDENKQSISTLVIHHQKVLNHINRALILFLVFVFAGIMAAVTRYRRAIEANNVQLAKVARAVEQTDDLITITDREGVIEYVNPAFEKLTGFSSHQVIGKTPSVLKSGKHDEAFYENLWQTILAGKIFRSEIVNRKSDGDFFVEEKTISPIRDAEGNITHYVSTAKDVTERKQMQKELMHSREMKILGQLASGVAHEVRNPLNAILAISEAMFQDFASQAESGEYLIRIRNQVQRLSTLMRDLLDLGKKIPPCSMVSTSLEDLCESSMDLWKQYHPDPTHSVRIIQDDRSEEINVNVNRGKFQQVLLNLLDNAVEHSPKGSEIRIVLRKPQNGYANICVQDQGTGIADENLEEVFEPFFTTRKSGTGLGLSIVKHIVETHSGKISIKRNSRLPGCCVEVSIPLAKERPNETANTSC